MGSLAVGDVVLVDFPFSDGSAFKKRPALVVCLLNDGDYLLCMITSRDREDEVAVKVFGMEMETSHLQRESYIRSQKIFVASGTIIRKRLGAISTHLVFTVKQHLADWILS